MRGVVGFVPGLVMVVVFNQLVNLLVTGKCSARLFATDLIRFPVVYSAFAVLPPLGDHILFIAFMMYFIYQTFRGGRGGGGGGGGRRIRIRIKIRLPRFRLPKLGPTWSPAPG